MDIKTLISNIRLTPGCGVYTPTGLPHVRKEHTLPDDLRDFYQLCGGVTLFQDASYSVSIVPPRKMVLANPIILNMWSEEELRADSGDDISWSWYIIAEGENSQYLTIDLSRERLGYCYDSFWDIHPQDSQIIAKSFTDLLVQLLANRGRHWYWLQPKFRSLGKAYD